MTLALTFDKPAGYNSGDKITATYSGLTVNPGTPGATKNLTVDGSAVENGVTEHVTETIAITSPGTPGDTVVYNAPVVAGVTFSPATSPNPGPFTATAP